MGYRNPELAWALLAIAACALWFLFVEILWIRSALRLWLTRAIGCVVIIIVSGVAWLAIPHKSQPSTSEIAKKIDDVLAELNREAGDSNKDEEDRLRREYPLGYVIFAFSGEKVVHLLCTDRVDSDWDHVKIYREGKELVFIEPLYLLDKQKDSGGASGFVSCAFGMPAKPGGKSIRLRIRDSFMAQAECIRAKPVGVCVVLGFTECTDK